MTEATCELLLGLGCPMQVANVLWAFATLGEDAGALPCLVHAPCGHPPCSCVFAGCNLRCSSCLAWCCCPRSHTELTPITCRLQPGQRDPGCAGGGGGGQAGRVHLPGEGCWLCFYLGLHLGVHGGICAAGRYSPGFHSCESAALHSVIAPLSQFCGLCIPSWPVPLALPPPLHPAPQNMSNAVLAFAKLEYRPPDSCLEGLARTALQRIKTFSPQVRAAAVGC